MKPIAKVFDFCGSANPGFRATAYTSAFKAYTEYTQKTPKELIDLAEEVTTKKP